jgi:SAM-dependent methyltransferase
MAARPGLPPVTAEDDAIGLCLGGRISPEVAIARLLLGGASAGRIADLVRARRPEPPTSRWAALDRLLEGRTEALDRLSGEIATTGGDHTAFGATPGDGIARIAAFFDRAVAHSPEASVALYSLGDPAILAAATAEIVDWLAREGLLGRGADVLDLGCGIGRIAAALAPRCRSVLGLDVSAGMAEAARRRCAGLSNVRIGTTSGEDLAALPAGAFDLVLAVDSFPYILQAGGSVAERHVAGAARALRPGGSLVILNLSYGRDLAADRADAARWAAAHGLDLVRMEPRPFALWDGTAFGLRRTR